MKIIQILATLNTGDAVGNDVIAIKKAIRDMGYTTQIYVEHLDSKLPPGMAQCLNKLPNLRKDDIVLYHLAIGTQLNFDFATYKCRKIIIYHNITPPRFFFGYDNCVLKLTKWGLDGAKFLSDKVDYCLADSEFNKQDLIDMGYKCSIDVLPILIPLDDYKQPASKGIINKYNDGKVNIVFTGRVAANKKHEDVIRAFCYYKRHINCSARLFLVGSYDEKEAYYCKLKAFIKQLELEDVYFTGHIKFNEILAYYKIADVFLCMSEHEGFCVPLVEAMFFNVPIIAYDACAVPETLGGSGLLVKDKNPELIAKLIERIVVDAGLKASIVKSQQIRLQYFRYENIAKKLQIYLKDFMKGET